ncbi:hypothetical protein GQ53DRAFT_807400 [Thozetella sp. PMI_491]|nr:hypothetical protein GQ53DRAFT_807400 [Thozetella sp. PMI_491]
MEGHRRCILWYLLLFCHVFWARALRQRPPDRPVLDRGSRGSPASRRRLGGALSALAPAAIPLDALASDQVLTKYFYISERQLGFLGPMGSIGSTPAALVADLIEGFATDYYGSAAKGGSA